MRGRRQSGFVLLLIVLVMVGIGGTILFTTIGAVGVSGARAVAVQASNSDRLRMARESVLGYAIGRFGGANTRPGQLPVPDTLRNSNYDGTADTGSCLDGSKPNGMPALTAAAANLRCLGRLPWKTLGMDVGGGDEVDATGEVPWYAVSENLADISNCMTYLNPGTAAGSAASFACNTAGPAWPWLKVCDENGRLISDRVAVVLIMPGGPIATANRTQSRSGSPRPQIGQYLDAIPTPVGWGSLAPSQRCTTYDNAGLTGEFVSAPLSVSFNDQLIYITIDELMAEIENRVATQVREAFISYKTSYGSYPWLAPIGNPSIAIDAMIAAPSTAAGLVPFYTNTSLSGQKFKTELTWKIVGGSDTIGSGITPANFLCFGGLFQCRIRQAGYGAITGTVTAANFTTLKNSAVATPSISCSRSTDKRLDCDDYTYTITTPVSYYVQLRLCCGSGTYLDLGGPYAGTQTRTVSMSTGSGFSTSGAATVVAATSTDLVRRSLTTASGSLFGLLGAVDRWAPNSTTSPPFDLWTGSAQTGTASTGGTGTVSVSNIRVYPDLPTWYFSEKWYEFMYAAISADVVPPSTAPCAANCFTAGSRGNIDAVVISAGAPLAGQFRYAGSPDEAHFLEAQNVTGSTNKAFAAPNLARTSSYADSVVTIPR